MGKTLEVLKDRETDKKNLPQLCELADGRFRDLRNPPSLQALKLHQLMFKAAGGAVADDRWHQIDLAEIRAVSGFRHHDRRSLLDLLTELRGVVIEYDDEKYTNIVGILDIARVEFEGGEGPVVMRWKFGEGFRELVAKSDYFAIIDRQTTFAMGSRYSLRLFEMMSVRVNLKYKTHEIFTINDLRARLGVPDGKLLEWNNFNQRVMRPAIAEVNQLARFTVTATPKKRGRTIVAVELAWELKPDLTETKKELGSHKIGRKARRDGTVEQVVWPDAQSPLPAPARPAVIVKQSVGFPADGSISYTQWGELARQHVPKPTPDVDMIASAFRKWAHEKAIPFDSEGVEKSFIGFCKKFKTRV